MNRIIVLLVIALLIFTGYAFKFSFAAIDTIPFYFGVRWLGRYLEIDPLLEHGADAEEPTLSGSGA